MRIAAAALLACAAAADPLRAADFACAGNSFAASSAAAKAAGSYGQAVPTRGSIRVLVVYAAFAGESAPPPPVWAPELLDPDRVGSLSHFYREMSFGLLRVTGTVLPERYHADESASAYVRPNAHGYGDFGRFAVEVLAAVDRDLDLRRFDDDGPDGRPDSGDDDGFVDYVFINLASVPRGLILGGATGVGGLGLDYTSGDLGHDGNPIRVRGGIGYGAMQQEGDFRQTAGVMAHEFGHGLGLPDLYDLDYGDPSQDSAGIGRWGLMGWGAVGWTGGDGPNPLSAWSLEQLGWISLDDGRLIDVDRDTQDLRIAPVRAGGAVVRVPLGGAGDDYLLLEQRTRASGTYDRALPGEGLLVWRVQPNATGNTDEREKLVDLVCADGMFLDAGFPLGVRLDGVAGGDNLDFWAHDEAYRRAHGGNWGDGTDPFDGVARARLHVDGNPSTRPRGALSQAFAGTEIAMRRQGEAMVVDVAMPRWAGTIAEDVAWHGAVWVDGDLRVAPAGRLYITRGTRVRLAGRDRLQEGLDPERVELLVQGDLTILDSGVGPVVFEPASPGQSWYGILLEPAAHSRIGIRGSDLELSGAVRGIAFPRAPAGLEGLARIRPRLIDASGPSTAGNGDGQLSPGETFQVALDVANWSLETYSRLRGELHWSAPSVATSQSPTARWSLLEIPAIYPGIERTLIWPRLTLTRAAQAGEAIDFTVLVYGLGSHTQRDTLSFVVRGDYPAHSASLAVPGRPIHEGLAVVPVEGTTPVEATIAGEVTAADLVVRPADPDRPALELPMARLDRSRFRAALQLPSAGAYELLLRVHGAGGAVAFSDARLDLWALPGDGLPALAFLGSRFGAGKVAERIQTVLDDRLGALGLDLHLVLLTRADATGYSRLLAHYGERGGLVVWAADLGAEAQTVLGDFLQRGGRLLLATDLPGTTSRQRDFLESNLLAVVEGRSPGARTIYSLDPLANLSFPVQHAWLAALPPAEPILVDYLGRTVGLRVETGDYRAVLLPFDLSRLGEEVLDGILGPALVFLEQQAVREASLVAVGAAMAQASALSAPGQTVTLAARVAGEVGRAEVVVGRGAPFYGEGVATLALDRSGTAGGEQAFGGAFRPPEPGRYRLALRVYDGDGGPVVTSAQLNLLVHDTEPALLLLRERAGVTPPISLTEGASPLDLDPGDWQVMGPLLERYLDEGDAVAFLADAASAADGASSRLLDALSEFVGRGGRLLVASATLQEAAAGPAFLRQVAGADGLGRDTYGRFHTRGLTPGPDLSLAYTLARTIDRLLAPSVPLARTEDGRIAAVGRRAEGRVVYLPIAPSRLQADAEGEALARLALDLLRGELPADADFEVPGLEAGRHFAMVAADRATPVRARVRGPVDGVDLLVQAYGDAADSTRIPMVRRGDGLFEARFLPPGVGHYLGFLQLRAAGQLFLASRSLRLDALTFDRVHPVLLLVGQAWPEAARAAAFADVAAVLQRRGLEANAVVAPEDGPLYESLLSHYLEPGRLAIWMGGLLLPEAQAAVRHFLQAGGRLLAASADLRFAPGGPAFLRDWLGVDQIGMGFPVDGRRFFSAGDPARPIEARLAYVPLTPSPIAQAALTEERGGVAGVWLAEPYRCVYLALDLRQVSGPARQRLLEDPVGFLAGATASAATAARLEIGPAQGVDGPVAVDGLAPVAAVRNTGAGPAAAPRAGYQILLGDRVVAAAEALGAPLAAGQRQTIALPPWPGAAAGDYRIRFGVSPHPDSALTYGLALHLHLAERPPPFAAFDLPGEVSLGNGAVLFDADGDGDLDVCLIRRGAPSRLWRNDGVGFAQVAEAAGLAIDGNGRGAALGDGDGDGDLDLYLVTEGANHWLRNDGGGRFADATAPPLDDDRPGRSAAFLDADGDGDLDLYLVNAEGPNRLFVQQAGGFAEAAAEAGLADEGSGRGLAVADVDDDGDPDLFLANAAGGSRLLRNDRGRFAAAAAGLDLAGGEAGAAFGDLDGDGRPELFVATEGGPNRLFANAGDGTFVDRAARDSLDLGRGCVGAAFLDADNDGDLDLATTAVNAAAGGDQLFVARGPYLLSFGEWLGLEPASDGRGLSVGDVDGDGRVDLLVADARRSRLYRNTAAARGWLRVRLAGEGDNRWGLGARVEVWTDEKKTVGQVTSALGYASQTQPEVHFGLGSASRADSLVVRWPDGARTAEHGVGPGLVVVARSQRTTAVAEAAAPPAALRLGPAYPNPFNAAATIDYALPAAVRVRLVVYGVTGQEIRRLVDEPQEAGVHRARWDGTDDRGRRAGSGVYLLRLEAGGQARLGRVVLLE